LITSDRTSAKSEVRKNVSDTNEYTGLFRSMVDVHEHQAEHLSTSSKHLDDLLSGGVETGVITQVYGGPASGKTHFCHTLCVNLAPLYQIYYIDIDGGFREDKIKVMARSRVVRSRENWEPLRQNIHLAQPRNSREQELCIEEASCLLAESDSNIKLLILDSLMFYYRTDYPSRSGLSERAHRLNIVMHKLRSLAQTKNIAVLLTNQCVSNPRNEEDEDPKPCGGNIVSYLSTYILHLRRRKSRSSYPGITATIIKSPLVGSKSHLLHIFDSGFLDVDYRLYDRCRSNNFGFRND
jgi:RecA/RadA recombinase